MRKDAFVISRPDLNAFVNIPTDHPVVARVHNWLVYVDSLGRRHQAARTTIYHWQQEASTGLFSIDLGHIYHSVRYLPLQALECGVVLAPVPPIWNDSRRARRRISAQHNSDLCYVIAIDQF